MSNATVIVIVVVEIIIIIQLNLVQFFIVYVPSQQTKGQLQTQHSLDTGNYITYKTKLETSTGEKI
jgi:hypothetical protein